MQDDNRKRKLSDFPVGIVSTISSAFWPIERIIGLAGLADDFEQWVYVVIVAPYITSVGFTLLAVYAWAIWDEQIKKALKQLWPFFVIAVVFGIASLLRPPDEVVLEDPVQFIWERPGTPTQEYQRTLLDCYGIGLRMYEVDAERYEFVSECMERQGFSRGEKRP